LLCILLGYLGRLLVPWPAFTAAQAGLFILAVCGVMAWAISTCEKRLNLYIKGARGEEMVARVLMLLPAAYRVFHGVGAESSTGGGAGDYDHVVVGPTGVFLIETKNWAGRIMVKDGQILYNGQKPDQPPVEQVKRAVAEFRRKLDREGGIEVQVQPVLCFAGNNLEQGMTGCAGVIVCNADRLPAMITDALEMPLHEAVQQKICQSLERLL
jgi:hypothetical protein